MKLVKMSMVAALVLGANVYAIDNVKVNGDAKLYYQTVDSDAANAPDMFDKDASNADAALHLGLTADLTTGVSAGVSMTAVSTLGLENNLVSGTWSNAHSATTGTGSSFGSALGGISVDDEMWVGEAWIAGTAGKTTAKLGRQALDTPLAFTETWGIDQNTFESIVLINQDLPDTTLVGAWVGKSNGSADNVTVTIGALTGKGTLNTLGAASAGYVSEGGKFNTFAKDGAYAVGVVNNSIKPLTAQAWYYDLQGLAKAYWLQADLNMGGILAGAQYADVSHNSNGLDRYLGLTVGTTASTGDKDTSAYSVMLGYELKDVVTLKAAYSSVSDDGTLGVANAATGGAATVGGQSKLYTEMWWSYGLVSAPGADSFSVTAEGTAGGVDLLLGVYSASIDIDETNAALSVLGLVQDKDVMEVALTASKSFGPLDATLALIYDDVDATFAGATSANDVKSTTLQAYLTYNF
jgi:hypothetical protein